MNSLASPETVIIGAGLAGLSCAVRLHEAGRDVTILEASDGIGGRVRTDQHEGFLLDRGFQVYLDAYPEAGDFLDLEALDLRSFEPGALVWKKGKLRPVMDVFRRPSTLFSSALAPIGNVFDKLLVAKLRFHLMRKPVDEIWTTPQQTTGDYLRQFGFSERMIDDFFRGFYGGIFLEDLLVTSSRIFEFTFKMFSLGAATLPAKGMQEIPAQIASRLPEGAIQLNSSVTALAEGSVETGNETLSPEHIVLATDGSVAAELLTGSPEPKWNSTACLYFAADEPPWTEPVIALKGDRPGLINNCCVPSVISSDYAPDGRTLISVSVLGDHRENDDLKSEVQTELVDWFGEKARSWEPLRTEHIRKALPIDPPGHLEKPSVQDSIYRCGDFTTSGSIEGAIISGLQTADQILSAHD
ncbi:MAG: NAD(P)/FAD-dependent oxidoreductase [Verrucomicrobiales bacterium]|nr:NAD(P)/FAD-dependent oxidoreductase [Verrucomicrobiales bacterium]